MISSAKVTSIIVIFLAAASFAQIPDTVWTRTYGGPNAEGAHSIDRTSDGGYIVAGECEPSYANQNVYLLKIDSDGDTLWTTDFGDTNTDEIGRSVRQTSDGGYIICGYSGVSQSNEVLLLKTDSLGGYEWEVTFGPTPDNRGHCVRQTSDGGYIITGQAWIVRGAFGSYDMYIIKTDSQGGLQWERFMGGSANDYALGVCEMENGDFVATGRTLSFGGWNAYLVRLSAFGDSVWARAVGVGAQDEAAGVLALEDGSGFVFTGLTYSYGPGSDAFLSRADNDGNILWTRTYGDDREDSGGCLALMPDGGYVIGGSRARWDTGWDVFVIRTDSLGNEEWSRDFGEAGDDRGMGVTCGFDGGIVVAGWTSSYGGGWLDVYLIKFEGFAVSVDNETTLPGSASLEQNYPNPFNAKTEIGYFIPYDGHVSLTIFDVLGRKIESLIDEAQKAGNHNVVWNAGDNPSGIYFYTIRAGESRETRRMAVLK